MRRKRKLAQGTSEGGEREREREEKQEEKWCLLRQTQEEKSGDRGKPASRGPTDTMLRLNIRCLNNQARFDPQRLPRGDEREKRKGERGRKRENVCSNVRSSKRNARERELRRRRAKEKERGRGGGGDSGSDRVGIEHVLRRSSFSIRARSSILPFPLPYVLLRVLLLHFVRPHEGLLRRVFPLAVLTLSVYTYYAKRVTVGGLGSQTRSV